MLSEMNQADLKGHPRMGGEALGRIMKNPEASSIKHPAEYEQGGHKAGPRNTS